MKLVLPFLSLLMGCAAPTGGSLLEDKEGRSAEVISDLAREVEAHTQAMARLPVMNAERIDKIVKVLARTKFPVETSKLVDMLGGEDAFAWQGATSSGEGLREGQIRTRSVFAVSRTDAAGGIYVIIFSYMPRPLRESSSMLTAARFYYISDQGRWFRAESVKHPFFDFREEEANQPSEPTRETGP